MKRLALTVATVTALSIAGPAWSDARVNVAHFAPFAEDIADTAVDIAVNGEIALTGVEYKAFTDYLNFAPDTYTIDVYLSGLAETSDPVISGEFTLTDNVDYTVYAVGNGSTQDLDGAKRRHARRLVHENHTVSPLHCDPFLRTRLGVPVSAAPRHYTGASPRNRV